MVQGPCEIGMGTWGTLPKGGEHWPRRSATGCAGAIKGCGQDNLLPILEGYRTQQVRAKTMGNPESGWADIPMVW